MKRFVGWMTASARRSSTTTSPCTVAQRTICSRAAAAWARDALGDVGRGDDLPGAQPRAGVDQLDHQHRHPRPLLEVRRALASPPRWRAPRPSRPPPSASPPSASRCPCSRTTFDPAGLKERAAALEAQMGAPGFWDDPEAAAKVNSEYARTNRRLETYTSLETDTADLDGLVELAEEDEELAGELDETLASVEQR